MFSPVFYKNHYQRSSLLDSVSWWLDLVLRHLTSIISLGSLYLILSLWCSNTWNRVFSFLCFTSFKKQNFNTSIVKLKGKGISIVTFGHISKTEFGPLQYVQARRIRTEGNTDEEGVTMKCEPVDGSVQPTYECDYELSEYGRAACERVWEGSSK